MKFVQTLFFPEGKDPYLDCFGWAKPEYHAMSWALSCIQLKNVYGKVTLYANKPASDFLIKDLQLPYDEVVFFPDGFNLSHPDLWALPKLWTYSLQREPFLHIDGDVYLFRELPDKLLTADVIGQNIEFATEYYTNMQKELETYFTYFPAVVKRDFDSKIPIKAINAGILGGNDLHLFKQYSEDAFLYIDRNRQYFDLITVDHFNVFFEQHLLYVLAREKGSTINVLFNDLIADKGYKYVGYIQETPQKRGYIHLLGHFKKDEFTCVQMAYKLRELYPSVFNRILEIFRHRSVCMEKFPTNKKELGCDFSKINRYYQSLDKSSFSEDEILLMNEDFLTMTNYIEESVSSCEITYVRTVDRECVKWYEKLITVGESEVKLTATKYCKVCETEFDWGGLVNYNERVGVEYYLDWKFNKGKFYNLIIPEISETGFSLYDIEDIDMIILKELSNPQTLKEIKYIMQKYLEEGSDDELIGKFNSLLYESIKRLVLYKAIQVQ